MDATEVRRLQAIERRVRLLAILEACGDVGIDPVGGHAVHALAYLTDALAPVWHLPISEGQLLKRRHRPFFPALQADLDRLVGMGMVEVPRFAYERDDDGSGWRLDADYRLMRGLSDPVLSVASTLEGQRTRFSFVREVVRSAAGLGEFGVSRIGDVDASYTDALVDFNSVLEFGSREGSASVRAARRFEDFVGAEYPISSAELVHLYMRHLYSRAA